jgi:hypothetical protein
MPTQLINNKDLIPIVKSVINVRNWEKNNLPIEQSALALDIFLLIAYNTLKNKPLTLKSLFHSIDFSEAGIRKHLRRLLREEWCLLVGADHDKRLRHVVAQPKMLAVLEEYVSVLNIAFGIPLLTN